MTDYRIQLMSEARDNLAELWLSLPNRAAVTKADAEADRLLRSDPINNGVHISEGMYRLDVFPLAFFYSIEPTSRTVTITDILEVRKLP